MHKYLFKKHSEKTKHITKVCITHIKSNTRKHITMIEDGRDRRGAPSPKRHWKEKVEGGGEEPLKRILCFFFVCFLCLGVCFKMTILFGEFVGSCMDNFVKVCSMCILLHLLTCNFLMVTYHFRCLKWKMVTL